MNLTNRLTPTVSKQRLHKPNGAISPLSPLIVMMATSVRKIPAEVINIVLILKRGLIRTVGIMRQILTGLPSAMADGDVLIRVKEWNTSLLWNAKTVILTQSIGAFGRRE